jgi:FkbM family methyltransferase
MKKFHKIVYYITHPRKLVRRIRGPEQLEISLDELSGLLHEKPTIIEAGASRGMDTVKFAAAWPEGRIFAFEPVNHTYEQLVHATEGYSNVTTIHAALGDRAGSATINVSSRSGNKDASDASSLLDPHEAFAKTHNLQFSEKQPVELKTLPGFCREIGLKHIDLMWLDMQGFELKMLQAAGEFLKNVDRIYMEVYSIATYAGAPLYKEVRRSMALLGFVVEKEFTCSTGGNVLFKNSNA